MNECKQKLSGYLLKWTNYITQWQKRYFVLNENILSYYINKGDTPKGRFHLSLAKISDDENVKEDDDEHKEGKDFVFSVDTGMGVIYLKAGDYKEKMLWVNSISKNIEMVVKKERNKNKEYFNMTGDNAKNDECNEEMLKKINMLNDMLSKIKNKVKTNYKKDYGLIRDVVACENIIRTINNSNNNIAHSQTEITKTKAGNSNYRAIRSSYDEDDFYSADESDNDNENYDVLTMDEHFDSRQTISSNDITANSTLNQTITSLLPIYPPKRKSLPFHRTNPSFSIWSMLKNAIGKDLTRITFPAYINEPLCMTQRVCENFQYADLLNNAVKHHSNPYLQLAYISAFSIGAYAVPQCRNLKFFNPLLGETFEYVDHVLQFKFFAEQVSHHPPITACHAVGNGYEIFGNTLTKTYFGFSNGTMNLEFKPLSSFYIKLTSDNTVIAFKRPSCGVRNLIGANYVDCFGEFTCENTKTGDIAEVKILPSYNNEDSASKENVFGEIKDKEGNVKLYIRGTWFNEIYICDNDKGDNKVMVFKKKETLDKNAYYFSKFAVDLNYIDDGLRECLPPTDTRLRPDLRALENQDFDLAATEKARLEDAQRKRAKERNDKNVDYVPVYFKEVYDDLTGELIYVYCKDYWEDRKNKNWGHLIKIFD